MIEKRHFLLSAGALFPLLFVSCLAALATPAPVPASQDASVMPLVPAANWRPVSSQRLDGSTVSRWGGDPAVDAEYGVKSVEFRTYQLDNGLAGAAETASVVIEEASDASAAYGLLTYYQTESMTPEKDMLLTVASRDLALMARGRVFLRFIRPAGSRFSADDFRGLLILVAGTRPSADAAASLPTPLPPTGLVPSSEKYLLGTQAARRVLPSFPTDLIGFEQGAELQVGSYVTGSSHAAPGQHRSTVLAITYPTPQIARARFGLMEKRLSLNQDRGPESLYGKRSGSFIFVVIGESHATSGLLDLFKVSAQVSGIPRYPGNKSVALQMLELILANLLLVILLVGTAVLGGVLIVLSKRAARRWFPDWEWVSSEGERLITLNLK